MRHALIIQDVDNDKPATIVVEQEARGIALHIPGYGTNDSEPGYGPVVLLEMRNGVPFLIVWADITNQEPTHTISLFDANEKLRPPDIDE